MSARRGPLVLAFVVLAALAYWALRHVAVAYVLWAWFRQLGFPELYWRQVLARLETGSVAGLLFGAFVYVNLWALWPALRQARADAVPAPYGPWARQRGRRVAGWTAGVVGALAGWILGGQWSTVWLYRYAVPFGTRDPIFHRDVGFYVFRLPLYDLAYTTAGVAFWLTGLTVLSCYFAVGWINVVDGRPVVHPRARAHLSTLVAGYLALKAVGYRLDGWNLLLSQRRGFVFGPGYADVHAALPALHGLQGVALLACAAAVAAALGRTWLLPWAVAGLAGVSLLVGTLYPSVVEALVVRPSQLARESPYIADNIAATRSAFDLTRISLVGFPVKQDLDAAALRAFQPTFRNIRLWDWRIAEPAFQELQGLRPYYRFDRMSIGRYTVDGQYRQVLIGAREIDYSGLPEQTWVNEHLKYTHGYGVVVLPSSEVGDQGMPVFWMQDITDQSSVGLRLVQPRVYFGLQTSTYAIAGPQNLEFDYPNGPRDVYGRYAGSGGIPVGTFLQRLAFSVWAGDYNVLLSSSVGPGSQALIYRQLSQRLPRLLGEPFLTYDSDPYLVIANGRLYWIQDAYTASADYPYSTPASDGFNYIRNSVKVVVDAYNGTVTYYVADPRDPIIRAEEQIFPGVFHPLASMPVALRQQIRYPEDLFSLQAQMYARYHMTDPSVFYGNEDKWNVAYEIVGQQATPVLPYYVILQFPGMKRPQFVLMQPFTPVGVGRDNMSAWLAAFCDEPAYGRLVAYEFPKEETVFGPLQVDSQINQDPTVAQILTLWSQGGSSVYRGNLLVIPIRNSLLYVEPLYQQAASTSLPALRRVIVDYGGRQIAVGDTLDAALTGIFGPLPWAVGGSAATATGAGAALSPSAGQAGTTAQANTLQRLAVRAAALYARAQADLRRGDFAAYGRDTGALGAVLRRMTATAERSPTAGGRTPSASAGAAGVARAGSAR